MKTLIHNASIINEGRTFKGSVALEGEMITDIIEHHDGDISTETFDTVIDADGLYLFPGVIDDHVHFREPGLTHKADMASESRTAAAGGVTSFMDMPNTLPQTTTPDALENKFRIAAENSRVNYSFFYGATNDNVDTLGSLNPHDVCGVKVFMGSSTGNMLVDDDDTLRRLFSSSPLLIMAHCEDTEIIRRNIEHFKHLFKGQHDFPVRYHSRIRSEEACFASSSKAVKLAMETGARLHVAHVSTARELSLFRPGPVEQKQITAEAVIAHLTFTTADYDRLGTRIKCNPSVKSLDDRTALRQALVDSVIDVVATDHAPHTRKEKEGGALTAASGMPMVQFSLVTMLQLADEGVFPIEKVVELMCHNPARLFRIDRRGFIRKGYFADLVLVDPNSPWHVETGRYHTKCGWTPMDERNYKCRVVRTWVNGATVYANGIIVDGVRGKALHFNP